jgi:hypothetical protein
MLIRVRKMAIVTVQAMPVMPAQTQMGMALVTLDFLIIPVQMITAQMMLTRVRKMAIVTD